MNIATVDRVFTAKGLADELGVDERTIRRWVSAGLLPAKRTGRSLEIRFADALAIRATSRARRVAAQASALEELRDRYAALSGHMSRLELELAEQRRIIATLRPPNANAV